MRGLLAAIGGEWEWFVRGNEHVDEMAEALGMKPPSNDGALFPTRTE